MGRADGLTWAGVGGALPQRRHRAARAARGRFEIRVFIEMQVSASSRLRGIGLGVKLPRRLIDEEKTAKTRGRIEEE